MENQIYKNEEQISKRLREAEKVIPAVQKLFNNLERDGVALTIENVHGFVRSGAEYLKEILLEAGKKDIEKMGIKTERLKRAFLNDVIAIDELKYTQLHRELVAQLNEAKLTVSDLRIINDKPTLTKEFIAFTNKQFTVKLDSPAKNEFWEQLNNFCNAFNKIEELLESSDRLSFEEHLDAGQFQWLNIETTVSGYTRLQPDANGFLINNVEFKL